MPTFEELDQHLADAEEDVRGDFGDEGVENGWFDLVISIAFMEEDGPVVRNWLRGKFGYVPESYLRLRGLDCAAW